MLIKEHKLVIRILQENAGYLSSSLYKKLFGGAERFSIVHLIRLYISGSRCTSVSVGRKNFSKKSVLEPRKEEGLACVQYAVNRLI